MTANAQTRPVKYAQLEWRNEEGERFEQFGEGCLAYLKEEDALFTGCAVEAGDGGGLSLEGNFHEGRPHGEEVWYFDNGNKKLHSLFQLFPKTTYLQGYLNVDEIGFLAIGICKACICNSRIRSTADRNNYKHLDI